MLGNLRKREDLLKATCDLPWPVYVYCTRQPIYWAATKTMDLTRNNHLVSRLIDYLSITWQIFHVILKWKCMQSCLAKIFDSGEMRFQALLAGSDVAKISESSLSLEEAPLQDLPALLCSPCTVRLELEDVAGLHDTSARYLGRALALESPASFCRLVNRKVIFAFISTGRLLSNAWRPFTV